MYFLAIEDISGGIVAEKRSVLLPSGTSSRISFILSINPIFSISSASSSITVRTFPSLAAFLPIRSISLPGVATIIWTPFLSSRIWFSMLEPPYTARIFRLPVCFA